MYDANASNKWTRSSVKFQLSAYHVTQAIVCHTNFHVVFGSMDGMYLSYLERTDTYTYTHTHMRDSMLWILDSALFSSTVKRCCAQYPAIFAV